MNEETGGKVRRTQVQTQLCLNILVYNEVDWHCDPEHLVSIDRNETPDFGFIANLGLVSFLQVVPNTEISSIGFTGDGCAPGGRTRAFLPLLHQHSLLC